MDGERPRHLYRLHYLRFLRQVETKEVLRGVVAIALSNVLTLIQAVYYSAAHLSP
jgi:hypothetical protein